MRIRVCILVSVLLLGCKQATVENVRQVAKNTPAVSLELTEGRLGIRWGLSAAEVKKTIKWSQLLPKPDDYWRDVSPIRYDEDWPGCKAVVRPFFMDDSLYKITAHYNVPFETEILLPESPITAFQFVESIILGEFGRPDSVESIAGDNTYGPAQRIRFGEGRMYRQWISPQSEVTLTLECITCSEGSSARTLSLSETRVSRLLQPRFSGRELQMFMANFNADRK